MTVAVSVVEAGVAEESTEPVVGVAGAVSVGVGVGAAAASVGLTVGDTGVSVEVGAVEVSGAGGGAGAAVVVATVSAVFAVGLEIVAVVVTVALSRGSLTVPPFQFVAINFAILVTQFPTTEERPDKRGSAPPCWWADPLGQLPECSHARELPE